MARNPRAGGGVKRAGANVTDLPLVIVAAVARNGVIGDGEKLPWRLPGDLRRFKALTMGKPMIMGRKTWRSIGRPLPGRETIVVTRDRGFRAEGVQVVHSIDDALALGQARARAMGADAVVLAGGGDLYAQLIDRVDRLYLTLVDLDVTGVTRFPAIDPAKWKETARESCPAGPGDDAGFSFVTFERCDRSAPSG